MPIQGWSIAAVRAAEAAAMARLPEGELMNRAAHGLARVVSGRLDPRADDHVVVLVGPGDNGGDALYAAAILARSDLAAKLTCVLTFDRAHAGGLEAVRRSSAVIIDATTDTGAAQALADLSAADIVIDGIAGIGGRPGLPDRVQRIVEAVPDEAYVVAVDLPSGADPDGEVIHPNCLIADETVTFGVPKPVHVLATSGLCGQLTTVDIGLDLAAMPAPVAERLTLADVARLWPVPGPADDKYTRGVLGVVAGGPEYTGAALLSVLAAVCAGAGMVRYVGPPGPSDLVRAQVPEAVHGWPQGSQRVQAWVVGPGLNVLDDSPAGQAQVQAARAALDSDLPCVIDAGGLDLIGGPRERAGARSLLTPHAGELARLLSRVDPDVVSGEQAAPDAETVRARPVAHARRAAQLLHATVLLKGATTVVVPPPVSGLPLRAQADAPPWLATAGAGDVLAGLAGMLLAADVDPLDAGALAALIHGLAAARVNPGGPIRARDVALTLPGVIADALRPGRDGHS